MSAALELVAPEPENPNQKPACEILGFRPVDSIDIGESRPWLVDSLVPEASISFFAGMPKVGKTLLSMDLAVAVATGTDFLGRPIREPGQVLYFVGEDDRRDARERIEGLLKGRGLTFADLQGRLLVTDEAPNVESEASQKAIAAAVKEVHARLVVVDPLTRFLGEGDENSVNDMRKVNNFWRKDLCRDLGTSVVVTHHTDKGGRSMRGSGDFAATAELILTLQGTVPEAGIKAGFVVRKGRRPEPMKLRLVSESVNAIKWEIEGGPGIEAERRAKAMRVLRASPEGMTQEEVRKAVGIRNDRVRPLLIEVCAVNKDGRWFAPKSVPDPGTGPSIGLVPANGKAGNGGA